MFFTRSRAFGRRMSALAEEVGMRVSDIDDDSALFWSRGKYPDYPVMAMLRPDGAVILTCLSHAYWEGREPSAAHELMERFDRGSERVTFRVRTGDSGKARCTAMSRSRSVDALTGEAFSDVAAEMIVGIARADQFLREHGYA